MTGGLPTGNQLIVVLHVGGLDRVLQFIAYIKPNLPVVGDAFHEVPFATIARTELLGIFTDEPGGEEELSGRADVAVRLLKDPLDHVIPIVAVVVPALDD